MVVDAGEVVVVTRVLDDVEVVDEVVVVAPLLPVVPVAELVVVVVGGATNAFVSPLKVATLFDGVAARLVQLRALLQLWMAAVAG